MRMQLEREVHSLLFRGLRAFCSKLVVCSLVVPHPPQPRRKTCLRQAERVQSFAKLCTLSACRKQVLRLGCGGCGTTNEHTTSFEQNARNPRNKSECTSRSSCILMNNASNGRFREAVP